jgi:hypothetical protein
MYQNHGEEKTLTQALRVECFVLYTRITWKPEYMMVIWNKIVAGRSVPKK